jgi:CMP-N,N'-diacetyllegionaminic acid synthase
MQKKYICIIPARKGSKGIKNKNIVKLCGKPLIQHTIDTAKKIINISDIIVSTDSPEIKKIIIKNNLNFYGYRPKKLSDDYALTKDVVAYEVKKIEKKLKSSYEGIILLQPTCPFRDYKKIIKSIHIINKGYYDSVVSIADVKSYHPYRMKIFKNKKLKNFMNFKKENMLPRQLLPKVFIRSGSFYIIKKKNFFEYNSLVGKKCYGYEVKGKETINIDSLIDLKFARFLYT